MDRRDFRQISQRYIAGKALDGASVDEIARGIVDPVEQLNYVTGSETRRSAASQDSNDSGGLIFVLLVLALIGLGLVRLLF